MNIKMDKLEELLSLLKKKEDEKQKNTVLWVLAIIGAVAAVAGIAFAVYRFFAPDYLEDFEEDFDDDFDDFDFGQRHHVNGPRVISERGMMTSNCGLYAGMDRFEARKRVVEELQRKGLYE